MWGEFVPAGGELAHHDLAIDEIFRAAETYKTNFQSVSRLGQPGWKTGRLGTFRIASGRGENFENEQDNGTGIADMHTGFARTPEPPYYAVIFTSRRTEGDDGYAAMADAMFELALQQPGCLGAESARGADGIGITVSYFTDERSIAEWKQNASHLVAQRLGKERWYEHYELRIAKVERAYAGPEGRL
jgi:heme-degrading monooxygenase HmoA